MKRKISLVRQKINEKRGMITIEYVMSFLIIIMLISFIYDLSLVVVQRNRVATILQDMTRVVQVQSGVETSTPTYFPTVGNSYLKSEVFVRNSKLLLKDVGIDPNTVTIEIIGTSVTGNPIDQVVDPYSQIQLKYKTPFTVKLTYRYGFSLWSQFIPGLSNCEQSLTSVGFAEYKQNYEEWESE